MIPALSLWQGIWTFIFVLVAYLFYKYVVCMYIGRAKLPPGPFPLPILGNILSVRGIQKHACVIVSDILKQYGDTATFFIGHTPMIVMSSPDVIRRNLIDNNHDFQCRNQSGINELFLQGEQDIIFSPYNEKWRLHKKIAARAIKRMVDSDTIAHDVNLVVSEATELILSKKSPVKLADYTTSIIYSLLMQLCYGQRVSILDDAIKKRLIHRKKQQTVLNGFIMFLYFLPGTSYIFKYCTFIKCIKEVQCHIKSVMDAFNLLLYQQHKTAFDPAKQPNDILDALMLEKHKQQQIDGKPVDMNDANVGLIIADIFEAGTETTAITLQWLFLQMALNPDLQEECYLEIVNVIGDRIPTLSDRKLLPLIEACIIETLRMHPPGPFGLGTKPTHDDAVFDNKYIVPKNSWIVTNLLGMQYDERFYRNPKVFDPKRYIRSTRIQKPSAWLPFGCGKRVCLGEQLAKDDLFLITTGLLQKLKFNKLPEVEYSLDPDILDTSYIPKCNYEYSITKR